MNEMHPATDKKVVIDYDATGSGAPQELARHIAHLLTDFEPVMLQVEVVVYGEAIGMLTKEGAEMQDEIRHLQERGVVFHACRNAMKRHEIEEKDLLGDVVSVPSGIGRIVKAQYEGAAYLKA